MNSYSGLYKIKTIAEMTGFNPNLLRAWERRYSLLEPERKPSGHRLFTELDRQVLMTVKALLDEGRSIGEVAAMGRGALLQRGNDIPMHGKARLSEESQDPPQVVRLRQEVLQSALELDSTRLQATLDEAFASLDRDTVLMRIMVTGIRLIGQLWSQGAASVAHERLASEIFCRRILQWCSALERPNHGTPVITACLPDEQHEMGALLVTYHLLKTGADVNYLGSLPLLDLELACRKLRPRLVLLSVTRPEVFEVHRYRLAEVISRMNGSKVVLGGRGLKGKEHLVARIGAEWWNFDRPLGELEHLLEEATQGKAK